MAGSTRAPSLGHHCRRHLRYLWRNSRDGGKSNRLHGTAGLSRLEMEIAGSDSHRVRSRMSSTTGQLDGNRLVPLVYGGPPRPGGLTPRITAPAFAFLLPLSREGGL